jgi:dipeptidyl aminopeptidase/acylaminoacyl peptidase
MSFPLPSAALVCLMTLCFTAPSTALEKQPVDPFRPSAIETENIPVVPSELIDDLRQYQNVRAASFQGWSPDGEGILIQTRFGNAAQLHRIHQPGGRREQVTFFDEPVGGRFLPGTDTGALLLEISAGGDENYQILLQTQGRAVRLSDGSARHLLGPVARDGSFFLYTANRRIPRDADVFLSTLADPASAVTVKRVENETWYPVDLSADGGHVLLKRYVSINESFLELVELDRRAAVPVPPPPGSSGKVSFGASMFAPGGRSLYLACDARGEFLELARVDLETFEYTWISGDIPWDVEAIEVHHETGRVAFVTNEDGASRLYLLQQDVPEPVSLPLGVIRGLEFSPDGAHLGFSLARPNAPGDAFSIRLSDGTVTQWSFSEVGGLETDQFIIPERISFPSFDELQIPAYYFRPSTASAERPAPVLINIHGGPESQYRPFFSPLDQYQLNELGIAVIRPNVRGSRGYGKTYLQLDNGPLRENSVRDIGALLDWIARQPELDAERVAVYGGSYGGYMVLASLTHYPERIRAGIDFVGIASFTTFLKNTSDYRRDLRRAEYGDERDPEMRQIFERINPTNNAHKIRSALFVAHGKNDPRVPFSEAEQIARAVRQNGVAVWTLYADNEGHGFGKRDNRDYLTAAEILFLQEHLLDADD